ncbi:hypothetical protein XAC2852_180014 [Xanthomonas citri pv. citri]|uniref:Uncharacterized protein n=1 Tax=Xanthomonas citri pv. citri TaxID=611301 RepID=A0A0U5FD91_XANCI|nr:hypothetical protein XAC1083_160014 [Xanthomonas citri pv. citri]CEE53643.1 hypothetical protein XAC71A_190014 [Xanthomonas citri pv. citri]CEE60588.1 hypothetical protein XAC2852_180014 [Xanthomonas citri pv. citri]CEE66597.1 hypothetical protein XAC3608_310014 [Xanthomonas citri pv. citri]CEE83031.1 hypothetical protein XACLE20_320013 [Xanthomonas citri pv. citri]
MGRSRPAFVFVQAVSAYQSEESTDDDDQSAGPQASASDHLQECLSGTGQVSAAPWRLHTRLYHYPEEAELGPA